MSDLQTLKQRHKTQGTGTRDPSRFADLVENFPAHCCTSEIEIFRNSTGPFFIVKNNWRVINFQKYPIQPDRRFVDGFNSGKLDSIIEQRSTK